MSHAAQSYVELFNASVRSGDWDGFAEAAFTSDAVVRFDNVPVPAMHGRAAIASGYREAPPDDTITLVGLRTEGDVHELTYRWDTAGTGGGRMRLTMRDGLVVDNVITLTGSPAGVLTT